MCRRFQPTLCDDPLYTFFLKPSFPIISLDQLKYRSGLVNIGLNGIKLVFIGYYWSRLVNIGVI